MRKNIGLVCSILFACTVAPAPVMGEKVQLAPQPSCAFGRPGGSITQTWMNKGGARLYWNTLVNPRQILMGGARFVDPAAVPELQLAPPPAKHSRRKVRVQRKPRPAKTTASATAPKGVGSPSLKPPAQPETKPVPPETAKPAQPTAKPAPKPTTDARSPAPQAVVSDKTKSKQQNSLRDILLPTGEAPVSIPLPPVR